MVSDIVLMFERIRNLATFFVVRIKNLLNQLLTYLLISVIAKFGKRRCPIPNCDPLNFYAEENRSLKHSKYQYWMCLYGR